MQMVLLSSSKAFPGLQERDLSLVAAKWHLPALDARLVVLVQGQADCEGVKLEVSLNGGTTAIQKSACTTDRIHDRGVPVVFPTPRRSSAHPQVYVVRVLL